MIKIDKIFGDKKPSTVIYILLAVGIVLIISGKSLTENTTDNSVKTNISASVSLEGQTEKILSEIEGVGSVCVMISYNENKADFAESVFNSQKKETTKSTVKSVLVVADGGDESSVREKIVRAVHAALGVDTHKIEVFERKEKQ